jgi:protocatechuate 3,4-dioxygenase beta subunit
MKRNEFLLKSLGLLTAVPFLPSCVENVDAETTTTGNTNGTSANCSLTNSETAGPFPIKNPSTLVFADVRGDRPGVKLDMTIAIKNKNTNCAALGGVLVDIWMCDAAGNYSEYNSFANVHWLRGRQTVDASGVARFTAIYPGWYSGRAPHIHIAVYTAAGKALLTSQIAFPKSVCDTVYTTADAYKSRGKQDTTNETDGIFRDGVALEMPSIAGSVSAGYTLQHTLVVAA